MSDTSKRDVGCAREKLSLSIGELTAGQDQTGQEHKAGRHLM